MPIETISEHAAFGGTVGFYRHASATTACDMQFSLFQPPQAVDGPVPALTWLSGLTCTEETFMIKAGAQRAAAELGLMLICPDTSPRGEGVADDPDGAWDFGLGAGFYLNATEPPWSAHYRMYDYVTRELQNLVFAEFPGDRERQGIFGHSMGGHGALTLGLKNPDIYSSVSAFAPICHPVVCPWGQKAFRHYLGADETAWRAHDATELVASGSFIRSTLKKPALSRAWNWSCAVIPATTTATTSSRRSSKTTCGIMREFFRPSPGFPN